MSEKQLLTKYQKERAGLVAEIGIKQTRLSVLDGVIGALRMVLGETPAHAPRTTSTATGTKALILDVLASGRRLNRHAIATAIMGTITDSPDRGLAVEAIGAVLDALERDERKP